jgi:hypothetical protein
VNGDIGKLVLHEEISALLDQVCDDCFYLGTSSTISCIPHHAGLRWCLKREDPLSGLLRGNDDSRGRVASGHSWEY